MRSLLSLLLLCALALCGCAGKTGRAPAAGASAKTGAGPVWAPLTPTHPTVTAAPDSVVAGKVILVDPVIRCVVLNFPLGKMAAAEQHLALYRRGLKVGEVKVTGPQREDNVVADLVAGEAQIGDEARVQ
jgi:hypothetical protein